MFTLTQRLTHRTLSASSCLDLLHDSVAFCEHDVTTYCATQAALSFPSTFLADVSELPPSVLHMILSSASLCVQCEEQVLHMVVKYAMARLDAGEVLPYKEALALLREVQWAYLSEPLLHHLVDSGGNYAPTDRPEVSVLPFPYSWHCNHLYFFLFLLPQTDA